MTVLTSTALEKDIIPENSMSKEIWWGHVGNIDWLLVEPSMCKLQQI